MTREEANCLAGTVVYAVSLAGPAEAREMMAEQLLAAVAAERAARDAWWHERFPEAQCPACHWHACHEPAEWLREEIALAVQARDAKWLPIETAPKDGTRILLLGVENECEVGSWNPDGDSWADENGKPCASGKGTIQVTGSWMSCGGWFQPNEVKAWCPIPPPPDREPAAR